MQIGRKHCGKRRNCSLRSRLVLQTRKNRGLFGEELTTEVKRILPNKAVIDFYTGKLRGKEEVIGYFRLFIVATGCPSERLPQKTVSC